MMMTKALFWGSIFFVYLGANAREGHLFFFFGIYLFMSAMGLFFRNREAKAGKPTPIETLPSTSEPS